MSNAHSRVQHRRTRRRPFSGPFWGLYKAVVAISTLIVVAYVGWNLMVTPPSVTPPPSITKPGHGSQEDPTLPTPGAIARKDRFYNILLVGCDDGHGNADTIMVLGYDVPNSQVGLVSIPRDTMINRQWSSFPKLNAAFGKGGVELLGQEITQTLGIPIDYYVKIDLNAFVALVDELGGLDFYVPQDMYHDDEGGFIINLKQGQQHLTGHQVLQLVRYRGYTDADIGRTHMQQQVLAALAKQVLSWNSLTRIQAYLEIFNEHVETDLSLTDMLYFAQNAILLDMETGFHTATLEGRGDAKKGSTSWCYELNAEAAVDVVNRLINPYTHEITLQDMDIIKGDSYYFD